MSFRNFPSLRVNFTASSAHETAFSRKLIRRILVHGIQSLNLEFRLELNHLEKAMWVMVSIGEFGHPSVWWCFIQFDYLRALDFASWIWVNSSICIVPYYGQNGFFSIHRNLTVSFHWKRYFYQFFQRILPFDNCIFQLIFPLTFWWFLPFIAGNYNMTHYFRVYRGHG